MEKTGEAQERLLHQRRRQYWVPRCVQEATRPRERTRRNACDKQTRHATPSPTSAPMRRVQRARGLNLTPGKPVKHGLHGRPLKVQANARGTRLAQQGPRLNRHHEASPQAETKRPSSAGTLRGARTSSGQVPYSLLSRLRFSACFSRGASPPSAGAAWLPDSSPLALGGGGRSSSP